MVVWVNGATLEVINNSNAGCESPWAALMQAGRQLPTIAVKRGDGTFKYPYYNESKGRIMEKAHRRRLRKQQRVVDTLNVAIGVAAATGGLGQI